MRFWLLILSLLVLGVFQNAQAQKKRKKNKNQKQEVPFSIDFSKFENSYPAIATDSMGLSENTMDSVYVINDSSFSRNDFLSDSLLTLMDTLSILNHRVPFEGYRIVLYTGPDRQKALITKGKAMKLLNAQTEVYYSYDRPYFRVKVGNFFDRYSAYPTFNRMKREFPTALLVPEPINIQKIQFD